ncbi:MAG: manganese efflux pump MntP family protein [Arachnia sp.]
MSVWTVVLIGFGVSADAFAVALTSGLRMRRLNYRHAAVIAVTFAAFQALMPLLGWLLASQFARVLGPFDHWIAFGILALIGGKMIWDAITPDDEDEAADERLNVKRLLLLGVATSIDAAAVGVSLAVMTVSIVQAMLIIGYITLALSFVAVLIGHRVGARFRAPAEAVGGVILVLIGLRVLLDHLQLF